MVMQSVTVTFELAEESVKRAEAVGVFTPEKMARLVEEELERLADVQRMAEIMDALQSYPETLTLEEIDAEIQAYRREKRATHARGD